MRFAPSLARLAAAPLALAMGLVARPAVADEPDTALALVVAAALDTTGFIVGGTLMATSPASGAGDAQRSFGWLTVQLGYTASPLLSHGVVDEWGRGALFAVIPAASLGGTAAMYRTRTDSVDFSSLEDQRIVWSFFTAGLLASAAGAIDVLFAGDRRHPPVVALRPGFAPGQAWISCEGAL
jgi:hypothetical protein